jgi:hypothetical protein
MIWLTKISKGKMMRIVFTLIVVPFFCYSIVAQSGNNTSPGFVTLPIQVVFAIDRSGSMGDNDPNDMRCQAAHGFIEELRKRTPGSYVGVELFVEIIHKKNIKPVVIGDSIQYDSVWNAIEWGASRPTNFRNIPVVSKSLATYQGRAFIVALDWLTALRTDVPGMKQHIIMITDDGWYESSDVTLGYIMSTYRPRFPRDAFPKIHTVVLTGDANPLSQGVKGLENIKAIADSTDGLYIEDATPPTIVSKLISILDTISDRVDIDNKGFKPVIRSRNVTVNEYSLYSLLGVKVLPQKRTTVSNATGVYIVHRNTDVHRYITSLTF